MRFFAFEKNGIEGLAVAANGHFKGKTADQPGYPGDLQALIVKGGTALDAAGAELAGGDVIDPAAVNARPPLAAPPKIVCVGLNYVDHSKESGFVTPAYPTLFARFASSLIGDGAPILRPNASDQLDYEGELVAVIGKTARKVKEKDALDHVAGYSIFNDGSIRDFQFKAPQWTPGKNFDGTGAFGPVFVTADELPPGAKGLHIQTRLNGTVVQDATTDDMVFSVASLIAILSDFMTLVPGDVIVTGTPAGVGAARKPPLFMKDGDICEVEIERLGVLRNPVRNERAT